MVVCRCVFFVVCNLLPGCALLVAFLRTCVSIAVVCYVILLDVLDCKCLMLFVGRALFAACLLFVCCFGACCLVLVVC